MAASYFDGALRGSDNMNYDDMAIDGLQADASTETAYRRSSVAGAAVPPAFVFNSPGPSPSVGYSQSSREPSSSPTTTRSQHQWPTASPAPIFPTDYSPAAPPSHSPLIGTGPTYADPYTSRHHRSATAPTTTFSMASLATGLSSTPSLEQLCPSPLDMSPSSSRFGSPMSSPSLNASMLWGSSGPSPHRIASAPHLAPQRSSRSIKSRSSSTAPRRPRSKPNLGNAPSHSQYVRATSVYPQHGTPGETVVIGLTVTPHPTGAIRSFRVAFGRTYADTQVSHQERHASGLEEVDLTVVVPDSFNATSSGSMPLVVEAADSARNLVDWSPAGTFNVVANDPLPSPGSSISGQIIGHKRSMTGPHSERRLPSSRSMPMRASAPLTTNADPAVSSLSQEHAASTVAPSSVFAESERPPLAVTWSAPPPPMTHPADVPVHPQRPGSASGFVPTTPVLDLAPSSATSSSLPTPSTPGHAPNNGRIKGVASVTAASTLLRHPPIEARGPDQPYLVRTTLLPGTVKSASTEVAVQFRGDLNTMAVGWTQDEWLARRRLVRFWRSQTAHVIECTFAATEPADFSETEAITVSCMYREDTDECYVTSVDVIYLLEGLMAIMFTVEEKNRIRRNLEGFRPETVSKNKIETERFFKTIMNFGPPRPRNIEKDVKVFPWRGLVPMLTKIMGKYSATPTATSAPAPIAESSPSFASPMPEAYDGGNGAVMVGDSPPDSRSGAATGGEVDIFAVGGGLGIAPDETWPQKRPSLVSHSRSRSESSVLSSIPRSVPPFSLYPPHLQTSNVGSGGEDTLATAIPSTATPSRYKTHAWAAGIGTPQASPPAQPSYQHGAAAMTQPLPSSASFWSQHQPSDGIELLPSAQSNAEFGYALGGGGNDADAFYGDALRSSGY